MNFFKRLILKHVAPNLLAEIQEAEATITHYQRQSARMVSIISLHEKMAHNYLAQMDNAWQQTDLLRDSLLTLVALDDNGAWTTVFDANEPVTEELGDYLTALVARS